jgi:hypothetical protein
MVAIILSSMRVSRGPRVLLTGLVVALALLSLSPVSASSANISRSYKATTAIPNGSLVSLNKAQSDYIELANTSNAELLLGVAVADKDSLLAVNASDTTIQVATSGTASVLVSDLNGDIKVGDQITVSPFEGIGMRQKSGGRVIGLAQTTFNANSQGTTSQEVTDKAGKSRTINVGLIRVTVGAGITSNSGQTDEGKLNSLQKITKSLIGHQVSTWRIIMSILIVTVTLVALITLTYAAIYGSIISVGRNPLGSSAIFRTLRSVLGMALLTAVVAAVAIYFLLH